MINNMEDRERRLFLKPKAIFFFWPGYEMSQRLEINKRKLENKGHRQLVREIIWELFLFIVASLK